MAGRLSRVLKSLQIAYHAIDTPRRIRFSRGLYFTIPKLRVQLFAGLVDDTQSMELSLPDIRVLFQSIRLAYDLQELREIKVGDLSWTTDCRVVINDPERVSIAFKGPLGSTQAGLFREDIARALEDYETKLITAL